MVAMGALGPNLGHFQLQQPCSQQLLIPVVRVAVAVTMAEVGFGVEPVIVPAVVMAMDLVGIEVEKVAVLVVVMMADVGAGVEVFPPSQLVPAAGAA